MNIVIRPGTPADAGALSRVFQQSWRHAYQGIVHPPYLDNLSETHWVAFLDSSLAQGEIDCRVALADDQVVGGAVTRSSLLEAYPGDGELVCLYLLPEHMGTGLGGRLLAEAERLLADKGHTHCVLDVLADNAPAIGFYSHKGYDFQSLTNTAVLGEQRLTCRVMRKALVP